MTVTRRARGAGRFAPTPSGDLHIGNLRTALAAWLGAQATSRRFVLRVDDLDPDRSRPEFVARQLDDLAAIGVFADAGADGPVVELDRESAHLDQYAAAIAGLESRGLVYECYCTRREIQDAPTAPHAPPGAYPGTCRDLSGSERAGRRRLRPRPALRLRSDNGSVTIRDLRLGAYSGRVDDLVLRRGDGAYAYNLAAVVDDARQGVDQVVRGDDLLSSSPRQAYLARLLGLPPVEYAHIPLVLGPTGARLAKRDGAVTLSALREEGLSADEVLAALLRSLGLPARIEDAIAAFSFEAIPRMPVVWTGNARSGGGFAAQPL